jgi:hypothetical protein
MHDARVTHVGEAMTAQSTEYHLDAIGGPRPRLAIFGITVFIDCPNAGITLGSNDNQGTPVRWMSRLGSDILCRGCGRGSWSQRR